MTSEPEPQQVLVTLGCDADRVPDEWVALVEIDWLNENDLDFRSARVAGRGKTGKEPLDQARPLRTHYDESGHFFTGPIRALLRSFLLP